jgi:aminoglycoside phosphotransferase (APT) family kinase protein
MSREWRILTALHPVWEKVPEPVAYCEDESVLGVPFYLMERVRGVILRENDPDRGDLDSETMKRASETLVDTLVEIHDVDLADTGLETFGRPEGYVERQVEGWIERYQASKTDDIEAMERVAEWMRAKRPSGLEAAEPTLIHNDYKYDNLVLNPDDLTDVRAVLDWEMATVGNPLMDLGTTLAYWIEPDDPEILKHLDLGPTLLAGNLTREEIVEQYTAKTGRDPAHVAYCQVFGMYKVAVIGQQLYYRYEQGHTEDPRLGQLIHAVKALGSAALAAGANA